jgi:hypothetical protein
MLKYSDGIGDIRYLIVDGMFSGTGIRDSVDGGYLKPDTLAISPSLRERITSWLSRYGEAHLSQYKNESEILSLDNEGLEICRSLRDELPDAKIEYYSSAKMVKIIS